jgi:hypothetical protein
MSQFELWSASRRSALLSKALGVPIFLESLSPTSTQSA